MKLRNVYLLIPVMALALSGCVMVDIYELLKAKQLEEVTIQKAKHWLTFDKVLLVDVSGVICEDAGSLFSSVTCSPMYMKAVLNKAEEDSAIKAVILRIDSPGGTVSASEIMAREIAQFRKRTGIPVYAQISGLGCSGAYYIAAACNKINIQPSAISGSIGVIAIFPKYRRLADKVGYEQVVIKSGTLKDIGSGMRDMTDEERIVLQSVIDNDYEEFLAWIRQNRPHAGDRETLMKIADGRIYTAQQAVERKLVDQICFLDETIAGVMSAVQVSDAQVVAYSYSDSEDANIYSPSARATPLKLNMNLPPPLNARSGFYYLWLPGE
ncbi:MAG: signal peptide peptidase SppA [Kiritimatiellae bacterium]|nr:signal peptide peptidase SppA [Kiritimatiellia bacterium]MDD5523132.1 signal peptide peptidase SppA [Kiritimatiellia bacterium]